MSFLLTVILICGNITVPVDASETTEIADVTETVVESTEMQNLDADAPVQEIQELEEVALSSEMVVDTEETAGVQEILNEHIDDTDTAEAPVVQDDEKESEDLIEEIKEEVSEEIEEIAGDLEEEVKEETEEPAEEVTEESEEAVIEEVQQESEELENEAELEDAEEELKEEIIPKTDFRYEDTRVVITAYAKEEAGFTQETVLKADYIQKGTSLYKETVDTVTSQMQAKNQEFLDFVCYDVYFEIDGVRVEPEAGLVTVQMEYKQPQFADVAGEATEYATYHINGETNVVEDVTEVIETNKDGAVTSVEFSTK